MSSTLLAIVTKILGQLLGYNFCCKVLIAFLELWAKSTKSDFDEKIFSAVAEALGVDSPTLKKLVSEAEKPAAPTT